MLRSIVATDESEFSEIKEHDHIVQVWNVMSKNFERYYDSWIISAGTSLSLQGLSEKFHVKTPKRDDYPALQELFAKSIAEFHNMQDKYQAFFDREALQEYQDEDPTLFKTALSRGCPVIHRCTYSERPEMHEWQMKFKDTPSQELLDIFVNLVAFADEYADLCDLSKFNQYDNVEDFGFEPLEEDENYRVQGVVGMGIKSEVLYNLYPHIFPKRGRLDVYGLYFLSGKEDFGLQGTCSEFLMVNDTHDAYIHNLTMVHNLKMDHNYWYPYSLFSLYVLRLARRIAEKAKNVGLVVDEKCKLIYVASFLDHVCKQERESIDIMLGGYQD